MQNVLGELPNIFASVPATWSACIFIFGLLIGSFLNVVIHRVPIMLDREWKEQARQILAEQDVRLKPDPQPVPNPARYNLFVPRSACPHCGAMITAMQNIPVISYLLLKGKCAKCSAKISARYPIVEFVTAVMSAMVAWKFGFHWYTGAALVHRRPEEVERLLLDLADLFRAALAGPGQGAG